MNNKKLTLISGIASFLLSFNAFADFGNIYNSTSDGSTPTTSQIKKPANTDPNQLPPPGANIPVKTPSIPTTNPINGGLNMPIPSGTPTIPVVP